MSLQEIANADLQRIMNNEATGGRSCIITNPSGETASFKVFSTDIHVSTDPGTGIVITGRQASVAVLTNELIAEGFSEIRGISDSNSKPWLVTVSDVLGRECTFKVAETHPDNSIGLMILMVEEYSS